MMDFVNGKDDIPYMKWNKNMFETTNQLAILIGEIMMTGFSRDI